MRIPNGYEMVGEYPWEHLANRRRDEILATGGRAKVKPVRTRVGGMWVDAYYEDWAKTS